MAMCGSGGDESDRTPPGEATEQPSKPVARLGSPSLREAHTYSDTISPLSTLLSHRNLAPVVLEHEKAFLVIKEHDYAKAPERPELLQLSALLASEEEDSAARGATSEVQPELTSLSRRTMRDMLLNCQGAVLGLRGSFARGDERSHSRQLREVVSLQVSLIREQQEQLYQKDRELNAARKEKEQLEARLERMERRLAVLQKHSRSRQAVADSDLPAASPSVLTPRSRLSRAEMVAISESRNRSRSSSVDTSRTRSRPSSHAGTPVPPDERNGSGSAKRVAKKRPRPEEDEDAVSQKKIKRTRVELKEIRTRLEYNGLELPNSITTNSLMDIQCNHVCEVEPSTRDDDNFIAVPSWHAEVVASTTQKLGPTSDHPVECEDLSDEGFLKRHKKPEEDEKRRKRWDIQRARALREHEELLRKYMMKGGGQQGQKEKKAKEKVVTFKPKLEELESIEVMETIAVNAFGRPLPLLKPSEFELPWLDLDARDAHESVRTTRSKAKARQSLGSSSTEEL